MNILFTNFHPNNGGGHATYIANLAEGLSDRHRCVVATPQSSRLYRFASNIPGVLVRAQPYPRHIIKSLPLISDLRKFIKAQRIDLIHANGSLDHRYVIQACLGLKSRPAIVWTKHNTKSVHSFGNHLRARFTDRSIGVSRYVMDILEASPYKKHPHDLIYHGINVDYFAPLPEELRIQARRELCGEKHEELLLLGSTGGTDHDKGWKEMVQAVSRLPEALKQRCRIVVAGSTPKPHVLNWLEQSGMQQHTIFPGLLDDIRDLLGACDVGFVLSHDEALSFACRESMAMGLPTIVSNAGGLPENIQSGHDGWVVPKQDAQALSSLLQTILPDANLLRQIGQNARKTAFEQFNLQRFCRLTEQAYERTLSAR